VLMHLLIGSHPIRGSFLSPPVCLLSVCCSPLLRGLAPCPLSAVRGCFYEPDRQAGHAWTGT